MAKQESSCYDFEICDVNDRIIALINKPYRYAFIYDIVEKKWHQAVPEDMGKMSTFEIDDERAPLLEKVMSRAIELASGSITKEHVGMTIPLDYVAFMCLAL